MAVIEVASETWSKRKSPQTATTRRKGVATLTERLNNLLHEALVNGLAVALHLNETEDGTSELDVLILDVSEEVLLPLDERELRVARAWSVSAHRHARSIRRDPARCLQCKRCRRSCDPRPFRA